MLLLYLWREDWYIKIKFEFAEPSGEIAVGDCLFSPRHLPDASSRYTMASFSSDTVKNGANTRHQSMYKQGVGKHVEASKERRRQATVQIRRSKKQKAIMAKRMKYSSTLISSDSMASIDMMSAEAKSQWRWKRDGSCESPQRGRYSRQSDFGTEGTPKKAVHEIHGKSGYECPFSHFIRFFKNTGRNGHFDEISTTR